MSYLIKISKTRFDNLMKLVNNNYQGSLNKLAKDLGKNVNAFYFIQRGERLLGEELARNIEEKLNLDFGYLDKIKSEDIIEDLIYIPEYSIKLSAGSGCEVIDETIIRHIPLLKSEIRLLGLKEQDLVIFTVDGDSMLPSLISGERVLIDTTQFNVIDNRIYAVCKDNNVWIKRLFIEPSTQKVFVTSDNKSYERFDYQADETVKVIGLAVQTLGRKLV